MEPQKKIFLSFCKDPSNQGISVWQITKRRVQYLCGQLESIPNFDSNQAYLVISFQQVGFLGDKTQNNYEAFYWVGSKSDNYDL
jgi:hypothetical protein